MQEAATTGPPTKDRKSKHQWILILCMVQEREANKENSKFKHSKQRYLGISWSAVLGRFVTFWKETVYFNMSVCLAISPHGTTWFHCTVFHKIWYLNNTFRNSVEKIQVSLKSGNSDGYFTWRPKYIYDNILLTSSYNKKLSCCISYG